MRIADRLNSLQPSLTITLNARAHELKSQGVAVTSLAIGEPDFPTPPHIREAAKKAVDANFTRYTAAPGIPELRTAAGQYFERQYGVPVAQESVIVSCGGKHALYNFMQGFLNPGDEVLLPAPYWLTYPPVIELAGAKAVIVPAGAEHAFKVTPSILESYCTARTKLLILNSPSNPTGAVYTQAELDALVDWALSHNIFTLSDEIYDQLVYAPAKAATAIGWFVKNPEMVAVVNGVSKTFAMTGWRVGWLAGHPDLIKKLSALQGQSTSGICSIAQKAALAALTGPTDCVENMRDAFQRRRDAAMKIIRNWSLAVCPQPDGAFYLFVDVSRYYNATVKNSTDICAHLLDKALVSMVPGAAFGDDGCIRLSYAVADDVLVEALQRVGAELAKLAADG
ncbi:MAG: pyridoxal phosphate-dependent aminotransferase [Desulfovibrio sp.]|jgi:aspartate aminotransferase|nr:pyridoxal phosphate-dependent aminotransferase [Desulfovibrio sp.]